MATLPPPMTAICSGTGTVLAGGDAAQQVDGRFRLVAARNAGRAALVQADGQHHRIVGLVSWSRLISRPTRMLQRISTPIDSMTEISWSSTS